MLRLKLFLCVFLVVGCGSTGGHHKHEGGEKKCGMGKCSHDEGSAEAKKDSKAGEGGCSGGCKH